MTEESTPNSRDPLKVEWELIPPELDLLANPILLSLSGKGGKRAEAGMWYAEVRKTLRGVYESVTALEKFLNQQRFNQKVSVEGVEVHMSEEQRQWTIVYLTDNGIIRAVAALDKLAQLMRCYFEHPDHGGELHVLPRNGCTCRPPEVMAEGNCSFGAVMGYLRKHPRNAEIEKALAQLDKNEAINALRPYRTGFSHRRSKLEKLGIEPTVSSVYGPEGVKTSLTLGGEAINANVFRLLNVDAHNAIVRCLLEIAPIVFPADVQFQISPNQKSPQS